MKREKKTDNRDLLSIDRSRREFLIRCCQGAALIPSVTSPCGSGLYFLDPLPAFARQSTFHLQPHYRSPLPLDSMFAKLRAGSDAFVTEKYHDQLAAVLARWSAELLQSPPGCSSVESMLTSDFSGSSPLPSGSRVLRSGPLLQIRQHQFSKEVVGGERFREQLRSYLSAFSKIFTAEFQITLIKAAQTISATVPERVSTRVRYEIVGSGTDFYRQQMAGYWQMEWRETPPGDFRLAKWQALEETQSRALAPAFSDVTGAVLGGSSSYISQLAFGVDYWRSVLDGASGIDIYGHNGVSVGDIDNDGFDDLYVCQPAGLPNRLYRNRGGGRFEDITESAGVGVLENTACALFADIDNDGHQDLIVVRADGPMLFVNQGDGKFRQQPHAFGFADVPQGTFTGAAIADYDRDGWLDIYFCLYSYYQGADQYKYPLPYYDAENGPPNFLMRNNRDRTFRDVTAQSGLDQNNTRYSFCCAWNDYNGDGWPDLYVVNDFGRKNLYRNNGNGSFTDIAAKAGVEDVGAGMSACWCDFDNDGLADLYVGDMWTAAGERVSTQEIFQKNAPEPIRAQFRKHAMGNSLFRNQGDGRFTDATARAGVGLGRWAWSCDAWDFDHDGFADLYVTNGMVSGASREDLNSFFWRQVVANSPIQATPSHHYEQAWTAINELIRSDVSWSGYERNVLYVNNRDGTFSNASGALGMDFIEDGRSFALADIDHDGRLEVFLKNRNGPQVRVLKNVIKDLSPSISFRLRGTKSNRDAIGAVVTVETESTRQTRSLQAGSAFLSQHSKELLFGLGGSKGPIRASIHWPSGRLQQLENLPFNHRIWIDEGSESVRVEAFELVKTVAGTEIPIPSQLPAAAETWLLAPIAAPDFSLGDREGLKRSLSQFRGNPALLYFWSSRTEGWENDLQALSGLAEGLSPARVLGMNVDDAGELDNLGGRVSKLSLRFPVVETSADVAAIYNILYRQLFDRHRDLELPTAFLLDGNAEIVKVYQGEINVDHIRQDVRQIPSTPTERAAKGLPFPAISNGSDFRRNYLSYGSLYYQHGYYGQAEEYFERALQDDPASAEALYGLGSVYLEQQKNSQAGHVFERVTSLQPSYPDTLPNAWNNLGLLAAREGRTEEAVIDFQKALQVSPDHPIALVNLGNAYRQLKRWQDAQKVLQQAVSISPEDPEANYSLGMVFAQLNDSDLAYQYLQNALKLRPTYPEALNNLGILYLRTGRRDDAVASFEQCIRVAPKFDQAYLNLARVYAVEANPEKARSVLRQLLQEHPDDEQAQRALAELGQ
ncbi:MAG TPA: FG-GAP-like repeat-containing protein [Terriglobales bacterium]